MNSQNSRVSLSGTVGNYIIYKPLQELTLNQLYLAHKNTMLNNPIFILKKYNEQAGYEQQKKVFSFQGVYSHYFVEACDNVQYKGHIIRYTVSNFSPFGSLCELGSQIKQFPLQAVKFYARQLFNQLKLIHENLQIPYRPLFHSDIIFAEDFKLYIVGWSKTECKISQQQLIYDCGQIIYYMITNSIPQEKSFYPAKEKKRFLRPQYWDTSKKKNMYLKHLPKQQNQLKQWIDFLKYITTKSAQGVTLDSVLAHNFFKEIISSQQAANLLQNKIFQKQKNDKQKTMKGFDLKMKRDQIIKEQLEKLGHRCIPSQYETVKCPISILFQPFNQKPKQEQIIYLPPMASMPISRPKLTMAVASSSVSPIKRSTSCSFTNVKKKTKQNERLKIVEFISRFLDSKLSLGIKSESSDKIFEEDWINLIDYKILSSCPVSENQIKFSFICEFSFAEREDILPESQEVNFDFIVYLHERKENQKCIQSIKLNQQQPKMHPVLVSEFFNYLSQDLVKSLVYKSAQ